MLTPSFELSQDPEFLFICIKAPFAKVSETEIFINGHEFKFYSKPYYLRLNLPGEILEDGRESATYDTDKGSFMVQTPKLNKGEHFDGLGMLTKILAPVGRTSAKAPLIEVLDDGAVECSEAQESAAGEHEDEFDWQVEQQPVTDHEIVGDIKYGFANLRSGVFTHLQSELHNVIDLQDADQVPPSKRAELQAADEDAQFDEDHYLADLYEDEEIKRLLDYKPPWVEEYKRIKCGDSPEDVVELTEEMKDKLLKLPRKQYILNKTEERQALVGLVDIIFAYAYNHRATEGENNVESAWNICKLSATLSWFQTSTSLKECVVTCMRRSLCYPLYRHWKLSHRVFKDTLRIFAIGRRRLLKCLLEVQSSLMGTESMYLLNDLYVTDYCVWIQSVSHKTLNSLAKSLSEVVVEKDDIGFELVELESAAESVVSEQEAGEQNLVRDASEAHLMTNMANLSINSQPLKQECTCTAETNTATISAVVCSKCRSGEKEESSESSSDSDSESSSTSDSSSIDSDDDELDSKLVSSCSGGTVVPSPQLHLINSPSDRSLIEDLTDRPLIEDLTGGPLIEDLSDRPLIEDLSDRPLIEDLADRPLIENLADKPHIEDLADS